jgi:hypothetical protein
MFWVVNKIYLLAFYRANLTLHLEMPAWEVSFSIRCAQAGLIR